MQAESSSRRPLVVGNVALVNAGASASSGSELFVVSDLRVTTAT